VIAVYLLVENLDRTSNICEMSRQGYGFAVLMQLAETLKTIEDLK